MITAIESELLEKIESNCSKKCYPMHTKNISISKCEDEKIRRCAGNVIIENVYNGAGFFNICDLVDYVPIIYSYIQIR